MNRLISTVRARRAESESGFTLIELIISVVLLTMVTGALGAAFVTTLNASANSAQRVRESNDAQSIASFLTRDAQAAGGSNPLTGMPDSTLGVLTNNAGVPVDTTGCAVPGSAIVRFKWIDRFLGAEETRVASYSYVAADETFQGVVFHAQELVRTTCVGSGAPKPFVLGRKVIKTAPPNDSPLAWCNGNPSVPCPASGFPDTVSMRITESNNPVTNAGGPYTYTLTASLRPSSDAPPLTTTNSASVPMLALGTGDCSGGTSASGLSYGGSAHLKVFGGVAVNATSTPSCPAVDSFGTGYTYNAAGLPQSTAIGDPYAGLPTPPGTCPPGGGVNPSPVGGVYQPGVYPQSLPNNAALAPGVFVMCDDTPIGLHGNGVLLYLARGTASWNSGTTNLTAASSGPYAGIVIWQPRENTQTISVTGSAGLNLGTATPPVSPPLASVLYAPTAEVDLTGSADLFLGGLVAKTIVITGNHTVTLGVPPLTLPTMTPSAGLLPDGVVGVFYSVQFQSAGGSGVNTWSATGLPPGLSLTQINSNTAQVSGTPNAPAGTYNPVVTVMDNLGDVAQNAYSLTIAPLPVVSSIVPNSRGQGATNQTIAINGANFVNGATVSFSGTGITVNSTAWVNSGRINVNISIAGNAATGARNVTVTNPDTGAVTSAGLFTVNPKPTITSMSPAGQGATNWVVALNGANFVNGATVSISGTGVTVNSVAVVSSTQLNVTVTVLATATPGPRDVTVTNGDAGVNTGVGVFTVNPAPTITTISPASHAKGANGVVITITGTNFVAGPRLAVSFSGAGITVVSTTYVNTTTITVTINLANNATRSAGDVTLVNGDGGQAVKVGGFTVT